MRTGQEALAFLTALVAASTLFMMTCRADNTNFSNSQVIHIGGKVLCTDCNKGWNEWINGAGPLQGGKVAVICMDDKNRVVRHAVDETDEHGAFQLIVDRHINGKRLMENRCVVKLVSSTHPDCNVMTDFSGGKTGVNLRSPSLVYRDIIEYTIGPFSFTSPMCDDEDIDMQLILGYELNPRNHPWHWLLYSPVMLLELPAKKIGIYRNMEFSKT